jgi:hypothetical protein
VQIIFILYFILKTEAAGYFEKLLATSNITWCHYLEEKINFHPRENLKSHNHILHDVLKLYFK